MSTFFGTTAGDPLEFGGRIYGDLAVDDDITCTNLTASDEIKCDTLTANTVVTDVELEVKDPVITMNVGAINNANTQGILNEFVDGVRKWSGFTKSPFDSAYYLISAQTTKPGPGTDVRALGRSTLYVENVIAASAFIGPEAKDAIEISANVWEGDEAIIITGENTGELLVFGQMEASGYLDLPIRTEARKAFAISRANTAEDALVYWRDGRHGIDHWNLGTNAGGQDFELSNASGVVLNADFGGSSVYVNALGAITAAAALNIGANAGLVTVGSASGVSVPGALKVVSIEAKTEDTLVNVLLNAGVVELGSASGVHVTLLRSNTIDVLADAATMTFAAIADSVVIGRSTTVMRSAGEVRLNKKLTWLNVAGSATTIEATADNDTLIFGTGSADLMTLHKDTETVSIHAPLYLGTGGTTWVAPSTRATATGQVLVDLSVTGVPVWGKGTLETSLSDATISGPATNEVLRYSTGAWRNLPALQSCTAMFGMNTVTAAAPPYWAIHSGQDSAGQQTTFLTSRTAFVVPFACSLTHVTYATAAGSATTQKQIRSGITGTTVDATFTFAAANGVYATGGIAYAAGAYVSIADNGVGTLSGTSVYCLFFQGT